MRDITLKVCRPDISMEAQLEHVGLELEEAVASLARYRNEATGKNRAEILFELLDVMNAAQTAIYMEFTEDEIQEGVNYTNAKSFVRQYQLPEDD